MFRIPDFYQDPLPFNESVEIMKRRADGDLLKGLESMDALWEDYLRVEREFNAGLRDDKIYGDDDDFFEHWCYEVNAYNVVVEGMRPLFKGAK